MIEARDIFLAYGDGVPGLCGASFSLAPGEVVSLVGENGSGKSTLARVLCAMRLPGRGLVTVDGHSPAASEEERRLCRALVGLVQQDPRDQIVSTLVFDEVAFGPRNLGLAEETVATRVRQALQDAGLTGFEQRDATTLSGGEQQRLALAGVLAMRPRYLVLDEATCQLDAALRPAFRALFRMLACERNLGIVQVTHDPLDILASDRVVALHAGTVAWEGAPAELLRLEPGPVAHLIASDPYIDTLRAAVRLGYAPDAHTDAESLASWLLGAPERLQAVRLAGEDARELEEPVGVADSADPTGACGLCARGVGFSYNAHPVLETVDLTVPAGRVLLLAGASGSGKSTLAAVLAGLYEPDEGAVTLGGAPVCPGMCALAFQNPEAQFFLDTVEDELAFAPRNLGCDEREVARRVAHAVEQTGLDEVLLTRYPFELSGGQARRVALASMLTLGARAYIFDEPTAGLDAAGRAFAHRFVRRCARAGAAVVVISHDLDEWLGSVDDVAFLVQGRLMWSGSRAEACASVTGFERAGLAVPPALRLRALLDAACVPSEVGEVPAP